MKALVEKITLCNFRCFSSQTFTFNKSLVLIEGKNGVGKTALLEAIHYLCYLKSFKTHTPRELIRFDQDGFFIQANVLCNQALPEETISDHTTFENECDEIQIGSTSKKRIVKINGKQISSFSEFSTNLKVVSLAECDMQLVQGSPECRRSFIDQYVFLHNPSFADELQKYRATLKQRNALFQYSFDQTGYDIWTRKLWQLALSIQKQRTKYLSQLTKTINLLQKACDFSIPISMPYRSKRKLQATVEEFMAQNPTLQEDEIGYQRTLFGTHLDDFIIMFNGRNSRLFASRGQQKLILILSKIAQIRDLHNKGHQSVFLLDDFMTDFDEEKLDILIPLLTSLKSMVFFTSAQQKGVLYQKLKTLEAQYILL